MTGPVDDDEPPPTGSGPTVLISDERAVDDLTVDLAALGELLSRVLADEGAPAGAESSLTLVDPHAIAELKRVHLDGGGEPTDVLSFPVDGVDADAELIGDVVLCPAVAAEQAPEHAGSIEDELALLVVHGGLHLAGWDHAVTTDRAAMWDRERTLLSVLHRAPVLDPWGDRTS